MWFEYNVMLTFNIYTVNPYLTSIVANEHSFAENKSNDEITFIHFTFQ